MSLNGFFIISLSKFCINMNEEIFPIVDEVGNVVGQATRKKCHDGSKLLHPVIHLHIFNSQGELFLQKRSETKDVQPNKWDSSVAGHIDIGETPETALHREASEEVGIIGITPKFITKYIIETSTERELSYCFYTIYNGEFSINKEEISEGRFWKIEEIAESIGKNIFTYNFELDFLHFLKDGLSKLEAGNK